VDAINKPLPLRTKVSLALDMRTLMNKLGKTSVITYYVNQDWALEEVQLAFNEVVSLLFSKVESS